MDRYDVAVVGLGAFGSATLNALARRGVRAIGLEQFKPGHDRGSSHGESRLIRLAYFEDPSYVPLVRRAYDGWRRLEAASGERVFTRTGIIEAGVAGSDFVARSRICAVEHGIPHETLSPRDVAARFPAFRLPDGWEGVFQADAGVLQPEKAIGLFLREAAEAGTAACVCTRVEAVEPTADGVRLRLAGGETVAAGAAVVSTGPWIGELAPQIGRAMTLTRQVLTWFAPADPALVTPDRMPAFLLDDGAHVAYGMPDLGSGVKAAFHDPQGVLAHPETPRPDATPDEVAEIHGVLARLAPAAAGPPRRSTTCIYTKSPDDHFVVGAHPDTPRIVLASPCSGHGFKFAPVLGEALADLATAGGTEAPIGLFAPERLWR